MIHVTTVQGRFFYLKSIFTLADFQQLFMMSYKSFLGTVYWSFVRDYLLEKSPKCSQCASTKQLHIHHLNYEHRGQEHLYLGELEVLCQECHEKQHIPLQKTTSLIKSILKGKIIRHVAKKAYVENPNYDPRTVMNLHDHGDIRGRGTW